MLKRKSHCKQTFMGVPRPNSTSENQAGCRKLKLWTRSFRIRWKRPKIKQVKLIIKESWRLGTMWSRMMAKQANVPRVVQRPSMLLQKRDSGRASKMRTQELRESIHTFPLTMKSQIEREKSSRLGRDLLPWNSKAQAWLNDQVGGIMQSSWISKTTKIAARPWRWIMERTKRAPAPRKRPPLHSSSTAL